MTKNAFAVATVIAGILLGPSGARVEAQATGGSAAAVATAPSSDDTTLMPPISLKEARLDDVLANIKEHLPGFNSVVIRGAGIPDSYPVLRNLKTDNISVSQFMEFLNRSMDGISVEQIPGPANPLWVVKVFKGPDLPAPLFGPGMPPPPPAPDAPVVTVFPLRNVIIELTRDKDEKYTPKQAMDDILSLVQATLKADTGSRPAEIQVHEATQMLVFKGTTQQDQLLAQTLAAFAPTDVEKRYREMAENYDRQSQARRAEASAELAQYKQKLQDQNDEMARLRKELDMRITHGLSRSPGAATQPKE